MVTRVGLFNLLNALLGNLGEEGFITRHSMEGWFDFCMYLYALAVESSAHQLIAFDADFDSDQQPEVCTDRALH